MLWLWLWLHQFTWDVGTTMDASVRMQRGESINEEDKVMTAGVHVVSVAIVDTD